MNLLSKQTLPRGTAQAIRDEEAAKNQRRNFGNADETTVALTGLARLKQDFGHAPKKVSP